MTSKLLFYWNFGLLFILLSLLCNIGSYHKRRNPCPPEESNRRLIYGWGKNPKEILNSGVINSACGLFKIKSMISLLISHHIQEERGGYQIPRGKISLNTSSHIILIKVKLEMSLQNFMSGRAKWSANRDFHLMTKDSSET